MPPTRTIIFAAAMALLLLAAYGYSRCRFGINKLLPARWQKTCPAANGFVGAYGRTPGMQNCLASTSQDDHAPYFNRCTWV